MTALRTTEKRILAELLVCGAITLVEYEKVTNFSKTVRDQGIESLQRAGILEQLLYKQ